MDNKLGSYTNYIDGQLIQLAGPDNTTLAYQYDAQQRCFYLRDGAITGLSKHGPTHVSQDPVPAATCDSPGLMSATDKCKLDATVGTRLGVLGYMGAGQPDDGGYIQGDTILAAGSEFISLERVGNVIRFVVDVPTPFTCTSEECFQVYWIQDETEPNAIRPPSCGGRLPGVDAYGELKVYLFPESTVINPNATYTTLNTKGQHPTLIFKRYDDGIGVNEGEFDLVLKRNSSAIATVGWSFTPGATGTPQCAWVMGTDSSGNLIKFELSPRSEPGLLGAILYKGSSITKQMAVITGYTSDVLSTNHYLAKLWDVSGAATVGDAITITNLQQWDFDNNTKILDAAFGSVLSVGQFVDVWSIACGSSTCYYCKETPILDVNGLWTTTGAVEFGDVLEGRLDVMSDPVEATTRSDAGLVDSSQWGLTNADDPMLVYIPGSTDTTLPASGRANYTVSLVNSTGSGSSPDRRYMEVIDDTTTDAVQRPVYLWHRASLRNALLEVHLAKPVATACAFPPIDVLVRAPVSAVDTKYATVLDKGTFTSGQHNGYDWLKLAGLHWQDLPAVGGVRVIMYDGSYTYGQSINYIGKLIDPDGSLYIAVSGTTPNAGSVVEVLHEEYTMPVARLQFSTSSDHDIIMQPTFGLLDVGLSYGDTDITGETGGGGGCDAFVREFKTQQTGSTYWQDGDAETTTTGITASTTGFYVLNGGVASGSEYYNVLRVMAIESQLYMWWNNLLIPPSGTLPYYDITDVVKYGKFGLRLWPGARVRRAILRSKLYQFSPYSLGQISLV